MKIVFSDIRSWILLFFLLRLYSITNPPLEVSHNWRQTTVAMVSRNFLETDPNVLYPRIDIAGEKSGITGMEFPFLNYLIFLFAKVFGYEHWYGRLINLVVSSFGLWFFYRLCLKYFSKQTAFNATFILCMSIWFTYSRKMMPDTFSMSFVIAGFFYGSNYLDGRGGRKDLILYFFLTLTGILSKLPSGYVLSLFMPLLFRREILLIRKTWFILLNLPLLFFVALYYFFWVPHLTVEYGFSHFFMGKAIVEGLTETVAHLDQFADKFYLEALGLTGFALFVLGIYRAFRDRNHRLLSVLLIGFVAFCLVVAKAGYAFYHHDYYIIPFAPVMAIVAAYALHETKKSVLIVGLAAVACEAIPRKNSDFYIKEENLAMLKLEPVLDSLGNRDELIVINSKNVPTPMYFAHRKGWVATNEQLADATFINDLRQKGLVDIVILKRAFGSDISLGYPVVADNADFRVYRP